MWRTMEHGLDDFFYVQTVVNYVTVTCFLLSWYMVGRVSTVKSNQVFYRVIYNSNSHKKKKIYIYIYIYNSNQKIIIIYNDSCLFLSQNKKTKKKFYPFASDGDDMPLVPLAYPCIIVDVYYYIESQLYSKKKKFKQDSR